MAGWIAFDPGGNLPAPLLIECGRLKVECGQHRAGASAPPCFFLCQGEDPAAKSATPQALRQKKPLTVKRPRYVRPSRPPAPHPQHRLRPYRKEIAYFFTPHTFTFRGIWVLPSSKTVLKSNR